MNTQPLFAGVNQYRARRDDAGTVTFDPPETPERIRQELVKLLASWKPRK